MGIDLTYRGDHMNNRSFRGPSGKRYTFDVNHPLITVEEADADHLLQMWEAGVLMFMETAATVEAETEVEQVVSLIHTPTKQLAASLAKRTKWQLGQIWNAEVDGPNRSTAKTLILKALEKIGDDVS